VNGALHRFDRRFFFAYVVCGLAVILYLPYLFPVPPSMSASYVFGYNNNAGIALLILLVTIGSVWTNGLELKFAAPGNSKPVSLKMLAASLLMACCACLAMYLFAGRLGGFSESNYEIDRIWLLSQGKIPYVDFSFAYGLFFLYGPILLQHLLPINLVEAYYLFWTINFFLGTLLLFAVVNLIDYPTHSRRAIFLLLFYPGLTAILGMGTNYTYLRFLFPIFFVLLVHRILKFPGPFSEIYAALGATTFTAILLLISPETAIAHAFACVCIFLCAAPGRNGRSVVPSAGLVFALAAIFWIAFKLHILDVLIAAGGGGISFPIIFAPHILMFIAALFVCACYVVRRFSDRHIDDSTIGLIAYSFPMLAAALGRCDPGHVFWNGQGVFLVSMFYASNHVIAWKWYKTVFIGVMSLTTLSGILFISPLLESAWQTDFGQSRSNSAGIDDLNGIYPSWHGKFLAPFGYKPNGFATLRSTRIDYGYFESFFNAETVDALHEKLDEIKDRPQEALLLPNHFERSCQTDPSSQRIFLSVLFASLYLAKASHTDNPSVPLCNYIFANYALRQAPDSQNFNYGLWVAKNL
jgi:hypothetical protein